MIWKGCPLRKKCLLVDTLEGGYCGCCSTYEKHIEEQGRRIMNFAKEAALRSNCKKKQLGCILVTTSGDWIYGWNGPPRPLKDCDPCPRLNYHGNTKIHLCRAVHAERRCLLQAARIGAATQGSTLYSYMGVPCKDCLLELIEAGVKEIVCIRGSYYDGLSRAILTEWIRKGGIFRVIEVECD